MLSDAGGRVGKVFGVFDEDAGVESRGKFIIDPEGVLQGYEVLTPTVGRNVNETFRQIQAFQLVRDSKGTDATPSGSRIYCQTDSPRAEKEEELVLQCGSGHRSNIAASIMRQAGYKHVKSLAGGGFSWSNAGYPLLSQ
jgi:rhodanese-related sulfurtransferase